MLRAGTDIYDTANYVGKSVEGTQRVYAHHSPAHLEHLTTLDRRAQKAVDGSQWLPLWLVLTRIIQH